MLNINDVMAKNPTSTPYAATIVPIIIGTVNDAILFMVARSPTLSPWFLVIAAFVKIDKIIGKAIPEKTPVAQATIKRAVKVSNNGAQPKVIVANIVPIKTNQCDAIQRASHPTQRLEKLLASAMQPITKPISSREK